MWWLALHIGKDEVEGVRVVGIIYGVIIIGFGILPAIFCRERISIQARTKIPFYQACKTTLFNKPFLLISIVTFIIIMSLFLVNPLALYINLYYVFEGDKVAVANISFWANTAYQVACLPMVPLVSWTATHLGKKKTLMAGTCIILLSSLLSWFFYTPKMPYLQLVCMLLNAPAMVSVWVVTSSMAADLVDIDELTTNMRREGMYSSMSAWIIKCGIASTLFLSTVLLDISGFDAALQSQSNETMTKLRLMFMLFPVVGLSFALLLTSFYPVDEKMVHNIRQKLDMRKADRAIWGGGAVEK
jgi:GPH family glycoside/pentoside/hexuronide:cation symporter